MSYFVNNTFVLPPVSCKASVGTTERQIARKTHPSLAALAPNSSLNESLVPKNIAPAMMLRASAGVRPVCRVGLGLGLVLGLRASAGVRPVCNIQGAHQS